MSLIIIKNVSDTDCLYYLRNKVRNTDMKIGHQFVVNQYYFNII